MYINHNTYVHKKKIRFLAKEGALLRSEQVI